MSLDPNEFWSGTEIAAKSVNTYVPRQAYVLPETVFRAKTKNGEIKWDFNDILKYIIKISYNEFLKGYIEPDKIWAESQDPKIVQWRNFGKAFETFPTPYCGKRVYMSVLTRKQITDEKGKEIVLNDGTPYLDVDFKRTKRAQERFEEALKNKTEIVKTPFDWSIWAMVNVFQNPAMGWTDKPETTKEIDSKTGLPKEVEVPEDKKPKGFQYKGVSFYMSEVLKDKAKTIIKENLAIRRANGQQETDFYFFIVCSEIEGKEYKGKMGYSGFLDDWVVVQ